MTDNNTMSNDPINLLLVDDEEGFVNVLTKRLAKRGINVTATLSGSDAVAIFNKNRFDIVLLDLKMEFMDGIDVLKVLKDMDPDIPVIMISGHGSREEAQKGIALGASAYLPKPYELDSLVEKIRGIVSNKVGR